MKKLSEIDKDHLRSGDRISYPPLGDGIILTVLGTETVEGDIVDARLLMKIGGYLHEYLHSDCDDIYYLEKY